MAWREHLSVTGNIPTWSAGGVLARTVCLEHEHFRPMYKAGSRVSSVDSHELSLSFKHPK